tara:strand:- start:12648 stop:13724 length:1077 start_codon:yes stop_codon:yes gene_type:complete
MAAGPLTQVTDVVVPAIFTPYIQQQTEEKARLIQSGILARNPLMDNLLSGGGLTFNVPSFRDLDNDVDNVSNDAVSDSLVFGQHADVSALVIADPTFNDAIPLKVQTDTEIAVRLSRNNSWSSADLAAALAGADPLNSIASNVSYYWQRRLQAAFIATVNGVILDNVANDAGDYENDISGGVFVDGVTNFSAEAFIDTAVTMGDSMEGLTGVMVHSVVFARMQKNNLIDFIPDARGEIQIPTFLGREVIVDDGMPVTANVYDTWLFGPGALQMGVGSAKVPTEVERKPAAGNGGGQEVLHSRQEWSLHPVGHAYTGTAANGGPANGTGANDLQNAGSWNRVYPERKQVKFARMVTREA